MKITASHFYTFIKIFSTAKNLKLNFERITMLTRNRYFIISDQYLSRVTFLFH